MANLYVDVIVEELRRWPILGLFIVEELLCCLTLHSTTTGQDVFTAVDTFFAEDQFDWGCVVEYCICGAPSMMGKNIGFRGILQRKYPHIHITASFIEELWFPKSFRRCSMKWCRLLSKWLNLSSPEIWSAGFSRIFAPLKMKTTALLLLYMAVRWLSHSSTLKRVFILTDEVKSLLHNRKNENATFFQMIYSLLALRSWLTF